jgi:hypothetical protein
MAEKMSELFAQDSYSPNADSLLAREAGLGDVGRYHGRIPAYTSDQVLRGENESEMAMHDRSFGRAVRGITQGFRPAGWDDWLAARPESPNIEATFNARWGNMSPFRAKEDIPYNPPKSPGRR